MKSFQLLLLALLPLALAYKPQACGSRGLLPCPLDQTCIADPAKPGCDPRADCPGICVKLDGPLCGGITGKPCPKRSQTCVDNPNDSCDPLSGGADCSGICVHIPKADPTPVTKQDVFQPCGGFLGTACTHASDTCVDDPRDTCDPKHGGADCSGICVGPACGGFVGTSCPSAGQTCVDDPRDSCDPALGGSDCIGVCVYGGEIA